MRRAFPAIVIEAIEGMRCFDLRQRALPTEGRSRTEASRSDPRAFIACRALLDPAQAIVTNALYRGRIIIRGRSDAKDIAGRRRLGMCVACNPRADPSRCAVQGSARDRSRHGSPAGA